MSDNYSDNYDDIIDLPHHVSMTHPRMSSDMRAAQFSPFAALTGYEECLEEAVRQTSHWIELDDSIKEIINRELNLTKERLSQKHPVYPLSSRILCLIHARRAASTGRLRAM